MENRYWIGVALGLAVCGGLAYSAKQWLRAAASIPAGEALVFDPPLVSRLQPWILPGETYQFSVQLRHQGTAPARIDELRCSCPCATARLGENSPLPFTMAPGESRPVHVTVTSKRGERGRVELRYGVIGEVGGERVAPGALAELTFAQVLNAEPPFVTFGALRRGAPSQTAEVQIWSPLDLTPAEPVTVSTSEPAIQATFHAQTERGILAPAVAALDHPPENVRALLGTLSITVDPRIAPEKLRVDIMVRSGAHEVRVPVFGLIDSSTQIDSSSQSEDDGG